MNAILDHIEDRDFTPEAKEVLKQRLYRLNAVPNSPGIDTLLDLLFDDVPAALADEYQAFRLACAAQDMTEIGWLTVRALERCATRYVNSVPGQNELDDIADELASEAA